METLGDRIKRLRGKAMSQRELAEAAGVSKSLVSALEQNQRHTASVRSLQKLAGALDVDVGMLLDKQRHLPSRTDTGVQEIRRVLTPVDDLLDDEADVVDHGQPVDLHEAQRLVDYAWGLYWSGKYDKLAPLIPNTLIQLRATARDETNDPVAHELLARGYWVTGNTLIHLGAPTDAWVAIRSALDSAKKGDDELLHAILRGTASWQLLTQGRYDEAKKIALRRATALQPQGDQPPQHWSVYGSLLISAATAAARNGDATEAHDLLAEARRAADHNGVDRTDYETPFGRSQVVMQTVDVAVVSQQFDRAVATAKTMPRDAALPLAAQARHLTDKAFAHTMLGDHDQARTALLTVNDMAPTWIRHQSLPRQVAAELVTRTQDRPLRNLARKLGALSGM